MATGVANRVLYKMALVPMGNYVFVLSQFQTFGYLLVYFGILATRYRCSMPSIALTFHKYSARTSLQLATAYGLTTTQTAHLLCTPMRCRVQQAYV